jgi:hypothetical protein
LATKAQIFLLADARLSLYSNAILGREDYLRLEGGDHACGDRCRDRRVHREQRGLGNLLLVANSKINIPLAFACLIGLAVIGIGLYAAVAAIELALKPWFGEPGH